jgi:hypothetical protein
MTPRMTLIVVALLLFTFQTVRVLSGVGYIGFFEAVNLNEATQLMFLDVIITLTLIAVWMSKDAAASGRTVWPYLLVMVLFGSAGPLLYLVFGMKRNRTVGDVQRRTEHDAYIAG